jgi:hypothetical protein
VSRLGRARGTLRADTLRSALRRVRPSSRAALVKGIAAGAAVVAGLAVVLLVLSAAFSIFYAEYGFHPQENARSWAALTPAYADSTLCQRCHGAEYAPWATSPHQSVVCESCHGPLRAHATEVSPNAPAGSVAVARVPDGICVTCHARVTGRPAAFPQVELATHYAGASCLWCHDPHDATALRPPDIPHSLDRLPACVTCHVPGGLKPVPAGHVESSDAVCRTCHARPAAVVPPPAADVARPAAAAVRP